VLLVPFVPTSVDLWTADMIIQLLTEARALNPRLQAFTVLNKAFPRGSDNVEAAAVLQKSPEAWHYLDVPIGARKAFSNAFGGGDAVTEYHPKDAKAITEMQALYGLLFHEGE